MAAVMQVGGQARGASEAAQFIELEKQTSARVGLAVIDSSSSRTISYRADQRFLMCSTFKVLAAAAVLKAVDEGKDSLDRFVSYTEAQLLSYAPVTRAHVQEGGMELKALCAAAVEQSDNTAANLLLETIGGPKGWTEFARSLGDNVSRLDRLEPELNAPAADEEMDTTAPAAMCQNLQRLFTSDVLSQESQKRLEQWMRNCTTGLQLIRASLPPEWRAGDKTGRSGDGTTNDIAVARRPGRGPVFLAIYTVAPGQSPEACNAVIAEATKIALAAVANESR
ncbi:MAG TPA: class A beta-lactamase [Chthoniobacterales bacterium]